jgi:myo-inositol 2-dehydrogenase / D-chiro-inositol 1-dehydrogenase
MQYGLLSGRCYQAIIVKTGSSNMSRCFEGKASLSRRDFLAATGATILLMSAGKSIADGKGSKINLGIIGCGKRGTWITDHFVEHGGYNIVAACDYFQDVVDEYGDRFGVASDKRFTGLSGYKKVIEAKPDAVAILSPPYFHPAQAKAAVDAGLHVFLAKPIAVDVPGCQSISESGKKATEKKLCFLVDFQTRVQPFYQEAVKRVQYGDIGVIASGEANYLTTRINIRTEPGTAEARLKNWVFDKALSGDIIVEQNIHAIDVASWVLDADPVDAMGSGGRKIRTDVGDCWDHFSVIFNYPEDIVINFNSKQFGEGVGEIGCRMYGSEGTLFTQYGGRVNILGNNPYRGGETEGIYTYGAVENIKDFYNNIIKGRFYNGTVFESVRCHLAAILGRTAAYKNDKVTYKQMIDANEEIIADLTGLKD